MDEIQRWERRPGTSSVRGGKDVKNKNKRAASPPDHPSNKCFRIACTSPLAAPTLNEEFHCKRTRAASFRMQEAAGFTGKRWAEPPEKLQLRQTQRSASVTLGNVAAESDVWGQGRQVDMQDTRGSSPDVSMQPA